MPSWFTAANCPTPLLFVVWSNVHGGYAAGMVAIAVALGPYVLRHGAAVLPRELGLLALCAAAPVVSPYGLDNYTYVLRHFGSPASDFIYEWKPYAFGRSALATGFIVAFLLFGLLRTVTESFSSGFDVVGVDRLNVSPKYSIVDPLPISHMSAPSAIVTV